MKKTPLVWIVDADDASRSLYERTLGLRYTLRTFATLTAFVEALDDAEFYPDFVVADLRMADGSFLQFLSDEVGSAAFRGIPFIVATEYDDLDAMRYCYARGARDYMLKPIGANEIRCKLELYLGLESSCHACEKARTSVVPKAPAKASFALEATALTVVGASGESVPLTSKEFQIMSLLERAPGYVLLREELTTRLWGNVKVNEKALDVHIGNLRRKIACLGMTIKFTAPGAYALLCDGDVLAAAG